MATYTITINERTKKGKTMLKFLKSMGVFGRKMTKRNKARDLTQQAINEIKDRKGTRCKSFEEYLKEIEK